MTNLINCMDNGNQHLFYHFSWRHWELQYLWGGHAINWQLVVYASLRQKPQQILCNQNFIKQQTELHVEPIQAKCPHNHFESDTRANYSTRCQDRLWSWEFSVVRSLFLSTRGHGKTGARYLHLLIYLRPQHLFLSIWSLPHLSGNSADTLLRGTLQTCLSHNCFSLSRRLTTFRCRGHFALD